LAGRRDAAGGHNSRETLDGGFLAAGTTR
jgi:hypothetical protein